MDLLTLKTLGPAAFRGSAYKWTPSGPVLRETEPKPKRKRITIPDIKTPKTEKPPTDIPLPVKGQKDIGKFIGKQSVDGIVESVDDRHINVKFVNYDGQQMGYGVYHVKPEKVRMTPSETWAARYPAITYSSPYFFGEEGAKLKFVEFELPKKKPVKMASVGSSETVQVPATEEQVLTIVKSFLKRVVKDEETPDFSAVYLDAEGATETEGKRRFLLRSKRSYLNTLQNKGQKGAEVVVKNSEGKVVQRLRFHVVFHEHLNVTQEEMDGKGEPSAKEVAKNILSVLRKPGVTLTYNHFTIPSKT